MLPMRGTRRLKQFGAVAQLSQQITQRTKCSKHESIEEAIKHIRDARGHATFSTNDIDRLDKRLKDFNRTILPEFERITTDHIVVAMVWQEHRLAAMMYMGASHHVKRKIRTFLSQQLSKLALQRTD